MEQFLVKISYQKKNQPESNFNLINHKFIKISNVKFVLDFLDEFGCICEEGARIIVTPTPDIIIVDARMVKVVNELIINVTKNGILKQIIPQGDPKYEHMCANYNRPPPPQNPPPRLKTYCSETIIQHAKKKDDRRCDIECRDGVNCWRAQKGICSYKHSQNSKRRNSYETEI